MAHNVFVTGGSGFIGNALIKKLIESQDVATIYALARKPQSLSNEKLKWLSGDLQSLDQHAEVLKSVAYVYHLGAIASYGQGGDLSAVNTQPISEFARLLTGSSKLKNFLFISSIGAVDRHDRDSLRGPLTSDSQPQPRSLYGQSKLAAEKLLRESSLPWTIVRPTWVYGAGMRRDSHLRVLSLMVNKKGPVTRIHFPGKVSVVHVDDLAQSLVNSMGASGIQNKIYYAQTEDISFGDIFSQFHLLWHGKKGSQLPAPPAAFVIRKWHRFLPLQISNLFVPYLTAEGGSWRKDFGVNQPKTFSIGAKDIVDYEKAASQGWRVITGANSGIGFALAQKWKDKKLILIDREINHLNGNDSTQVIQADLTDGKSLANLAERLKGQPLEILVNNAGVGYKGDTTALTSQKIQTMIDVNITAPIKLVQLLGAELVKSGTTIINVGSSVGFFPLPGMSVYAASKSALVSWSESLAVELKGTNTVITYCPSGTYTKFQENAGVKVNANQGLKTPEDVADSIDRKMRCGCSSTYLPGGAFRILYWASHVLPRRFVANLWGKLFKAQR